MPKPMSQNLENVVRKFHSVHGAEKQFNSQFSGHYRTQQPRKIAITFIDGEPIYSDDPRILKAKLELQQSLPTRFSEIPEFTAPEEDVVLSTNWEKLSCMTNVPSNTNGGGYQVRKDHTNGQLTSVERKILDYVIEETTKTRIITDTDYHAYVKRDSSVGSPWYKSDPKYKDLALMAGYDVAAYASGKDYKTHRDFVLDLINEKDFISTIKVGFRNSLDSREKERYTEDVNGKLVLTDKQIAVDSKYYQDLLHEFTVHGIPQSILSELNIYGNRARHIFAFGMINTLLSLAQRSTIADSKEHFPFFRDNGPEINMINLMNENMADFGSTDDDGSYYFITLDLKNFDKTWPPEVADKIWSATDRQLPRPWNILNHLLHASFTWMPPQSKKDVGPKAYISHDPLVDDIEKWNYTSHPSGNANTKRNNDICALWLIEVILYYAGVPSILRNKHRLMSREFPMSLKIAGDDMIICTRNLAWAKAIKKIVPIKIVDFEVDVEYPLKWLNMNVVRTKDGKLAFRRNVEAYLDKVLNPENSINVDSTGAIKPFAITGYYLRKVAYDSPYFAQVDGLMVEALERNLGLKESKIFELDELSKNIIKGIANDTNLAINAAIFLNDPDKLHYVEALEKLPDEVKLLQYYSFSSDSLRRISSAASNGQPFPDLKLTEKSQDLDVVLALLNKRL